MNAKDILASRLRLKALVLAEDIVRDECRDRLADARRAWLVAERALRDADRALALAETHVTEAEARHEKYSASLADFEKATAPKRRRRHG